MAAGDTFFQMRRIAAVFQHINVVIRFDYHGFAADETGFDIAGDVTDIGGVAQCRAAEIKTVAHRTHCVVRGAEGRHARFGQAYVGGQSLVKRDYVLRRRVGVYHYPTRHIRRINRETVFLHGVHHTLDVVRVLVRYEDTAQIFRRCAERRQRAFKRAEGDSGVDEEFLSAVFYVCTVAL